MATHKVGKLITLEGVEGAGKSSQIAFMQELLTAASIDSITTREPGGTPLAEAIRSVLLDGDAMPAETELLLMFAARSAHVTEKIRPALQAGTWVICDRFVDASYAYQGAGRNIAAEQIKFLENMTLKGLNPDLVCIFDLDVEIGLQRAKSRGEQNRFDKEDIAFMQRVRDAYLQRAAADPNRYAVLDACQPIERVSAQISGVIQELISQPC